MKTNFKSKGWRIAVGICIPLFMLAGAIFLYIVKKGPPCMMYQLTGIYCAGCGAGRASVALLHGNLITAFDYNPLFIILLPFMAYYIVKVYIAYVFDKDVLPFFNINMLAAIVILAVVVVFTVLRNIPVYPFTYLAP